MLGRVVRPQNRRRCVTASSLDAGGRATEIKMSAQAPGHPGTCEAFCSMRLREQRSRRWRVWIQESDGHPSGLWEKVPRGRPSSRSEERSRRKASKPRPRFRAGMTDLLRGNLFEQLYIPKLEARELVSIGRCSSSATRRSGSHRPASAFFELELQPSCLHRRRQRVASRFEADDITGGGTTIPNSRRSRAGAHVLFDADGEAHVVDALRCVKVDDRPNRK